MPETNDSTLDVNTNVSEARAKFEQARLSRRSALRKLGMTGGMALFSLLAVDYLARLAVKKLAQHQETKALANSLAHDFKDMGVAFAASGSGGPDCTHCYKQDNADVQAAYDRYAACYGQRLAAGASPSDADKACSPAFNNDVLYAYNQCNGCVATHCPTGSAPCAAPPK